MCFREPVEDANVPVGCGYRSCLGSPFVPWREVRTSLAVRAERHGTEEALIGCGPVEGSRQGTEALSGCAPGLDGALNVFGLAIHRADREASRVTGACGPVGKAARKGTR